MNKTMKIWVGVLIATVTLVIGIAVGRKMSMAKTADKTAAEGAAVTSNTASK